jgi:LmbE family N-acetylglucosaminyl deacetylase
MSNPYLKFVSEYARLINEGKNYQQGGFPPSAHAPLAKDAPRVLIFSPHPDDECLVGALPLRLRRELKMNVINVAVTLGSRKDRRMERLAELRNACDYLGFGLIQIGERGLEKINMANRKQNADAWRENVRLVAEIIEENKPHVIFLPHEHDWNSTHIGTHFLVMDALQSLPESFYCRACATEFWAPMADPNLMVEVSVADLADLVTALSFHVGEISRNPYHLRLPAWMQDNVRRGGEIVGGQGVEAPNFMFSTLYRLQKWAHHKLCEMAGENAGRQARPVCQPARFVSCNESLAAFFS